MSDWLDPLRLALDEAGTPIEFFFRDDDGGWSDTRLLKLLDCFDQYSVPIDLAVIPAALTTTMAQELAARVATNPRRIGIHQHGFAHSNHEQSGRKCEFGVSRSIDLQCLDIERGKLRLAELLGTVVNPIFTPPWNRCTRATGERLVRLGFSALSRDHTARPLELPGLIELPIQIDWFAKQKGLRVGRGCISKAIAGSVRQGQLIGIMLHHQLMEAEDRLAMSELLALIKTHQKARSNLMHELVLPREASASAGAAPVLVRRES